LAKQFSGGIGERAAVAKRILRRYLPVAAGNGLVEHPGEACQHQLLIQRSAPAFAAGSIQQSQNALRAVRLDDPTSTERKLQVPIVDQAQRLSAIRFRGQLASEMTTDSSKKDIAPLEWRELWTYLGGEVNASVRVDSVHSSFHLVSRRTGCLRLD
jgi:hypothetical protein